MLILKTLTFSSLVLSTVLTTDLKLFLESSFGLLQALPLAYFGRKYHGLLLRYMSCSDASI